MFNSLKGQAYDVRTSHRYASLTNKPYKSTNSSPTSISRRHSLVGPKEYSYTNINDSNIFAIREKKNNLDSFKQNLSLLKSSYNTIKEEHLNFQNEIFTFMEQFKDMMFELSSDQTRNKAKDQVTKKVYQLISELDSTKFEMKKKLKEKDQKIQELQLCLREKEHEIVTGQKKLQIKKDELKSKEKSILNLERTCNDLKQRHQQELDKLENARISLENQYVRELTATNQEKEELRLRVAQQVQKEKETSTRMRLPEQGHSDFLNNEIDILKEDKKILGLQVQSLQARNKAFEKEKEQDRRYFEQKCQEISNEFEEKILYLQQELEMTVRDANLTQAQFEQKSVEVNEFKRELDQKVTQLEEANAQLEKKDKVIDELREEIKRQNQPNIPSNRPGQKSLGSKNKTDRSVSPNVGNVSFNSERQNTRTSGQDSQQRQTTQITQRTTHKEVSPNQPQKTASSSRVSQNISQPILREKDLNEKLQELKIRNDALKLENSNLTAKLVIRDNENHNLKQKLEKAKDQTKSSFSTLENDSAVTDETRHLQKLLQSHEKQLRKANLEIKKLTAIKQELELVVKENKEESKQSCNTKEYDTFELDSSKDLEQRQETKLLTENELTKIYKDSKFWFVIEESQLDCLQRENNELKLEISLKDQKMQNLMKLSTNSLKVVTEEFMKMASSNFLKVHEKVIQISSKSSKFENLVKKLISEHQGVNTEFKKLSEEKRKITQQIKEGISNLCSNIRSQKMSADSSREKQGTDVPSVLSDRTLKEENRIKRSKKLSSSFDAENQAKSFEEKNKAENQKEKSPSKPYTQPKNNIGRKEKSGSIKAYHSEKRNSDPNTFNQRRRLGSKSSLSLSPDPKGNFSSNKKEDDLSLQQIFEEMKHLKKIFASDEGNFDSENNAKNEQKILELISEVLSPKGFAKGKLEDIKETEHETDTLQDEVKPNHSNITH